MATSVLVLEKGPRHTMNWTKLFAFGLWRWNLKFLSEWARRDQCSVQHRVHIFDGIWSQKPDFQTFTETKKLNYEWHEYRPVSRPYYHQLNSRYPNFAARKIRSRKLTFYSLNLCAGFSAFRASRSIFYETKTTQPHEHCTTIPVVVSSNHFFHVLNSFIQLSLVLSCE